MIDVVGAIGGTGIASKRCVWHARRGVTREKLLAAFLDDTLGPGDLLLALIVIEKIPFPVGIGF